MAVDVLDEAAELVDLAGALVGLEGRDALLERRLGERKVLAALVLALGQHRQGQAHHIVPVCVRVCMRSPEW